MAQYRVQRKALVNPIKKLPVTNGVVNFLISDRLPAFSRMSVAIDFIITFELMSSSSLGFLLQLSYGVEK